MKKKARKKKYFRWIYAVDFDGLLVENAFPRIGKKKRFNCWVVNMLASFGHVNILWTCRVDDKEEAAWQFCLYNGICVDYKNESPPFIIEKYKKDNRKVFANRYLDDRNPLWNPLVMVYVLIEGWLVSKFGGR